MKLKSIRLLGFKSFADETIIEIEDSITCIVGPNGCGKSNILDAVRWVLGEKSARGLRGQQMDDLIFLGSKMRKPAGMAEVEICFDNSDRSLKLDKDEFCISRRLYISSNSEYYMDGKRIARHELEKIFQNTGIGKNSYSIISQGKVSEILQATPESRRLLVDEAAGIARFKLERQETLKQLDESKQNSMRANDILKTKSKESEKLREQAEKTQKYIKLRDKVNEHTKNCYYLDIKDLRKSFIEIKIRLSALQKKREASLSDVKIWNNKKQVLEDKCQEQLEHSHLLDRAYHQKVVSINSLKKREDWIKREYDERQRNIKDIEKRYEVEIKKNKGIEKQYNYSMQLQLNIQTDLGKLREKSKSFQEKLELLKDKIEGSKKEEEANEKLIQAKEASHAKLLHSLKGVAQEILLELEEKKETLQERKTQQDELKEAIQKQLNLQGKVIQEILQLIKATDLKGIKVAFTKLEVEKLSSQSISKNFEMYEAIASEIRSFLLDPSGLLGKKEAIDTEMNNISLSIEAIKKEIKLEQSRRNNYFRSLEENKHSKQEVDLHIRDCEVRNESCLENQKKNEDLLREAKERTDYFKKKKLSEESQLQEIKKEKESNLEEQSLVQKDMEQEKKQIDLLRPQIKNDKEKLAVLIDKIEAVQRSSEDILPKITKEERSSEQVRVRLEQLEQDLSNFFECKFEELEQSLAKLNLNKRREEQEKREVTQKIKELGSYNALALDEFEMNNKEIEQLKYQQKDIEEARKNLLNALKELDQKSRDTFEKIFAEIQQKFNQIFSKLFHGGKAVLKLSNPDDVLSSGIDIMAQPPGKNNTSIALLSGGEQGLTTISLIFALYLVRPSPFCFLDEVDAPLDDLNVKRFLDMLKEYSPKTQFIIITHNKISMSYGGSILGVTQEELGVSQLVSVRFNSNTSKKQLKIS